MTFRGWRGVRQWSFFLVMAGLALLFISATGGDKGFRLAGGLGMTVAGIILAILRKDAVVFASPAGVQVRQEVRLIGKNLHTKNMLLSSPVLLLHVGYGRGAFVTATIHSELNSIVVGEGGSEVIEAATQCQTLGVRLAVTQAFLRGVDEYERIGVPSDVPIWRGQTRSG